MSFDRAIAATLLPGFIGTELPDWLAARLRGGLGGVCIFGQNIRSRTQLRALTDAVYAANPEAIVAIDEEGGDVTRLYHESGSPYPGNAALGRIDDLGYTEEIAQLVGRELRRVGCNLNFAPVVDVNSNPDNPVIGVRSFGATPQRVAAHGAAWTRGLQSAGVAASAKHFPGHGDTATDSHLAMPVVDRSLHQLRQRELVPFAAVIDAGVRTIMTSHILLPQLDPANPATLSRRILGGLLRDELGFDGVIVSDALDMAGASGVDGIPVAAARALAAGCDLLCIGTGNTDEQLDQIVHEIRRAVASGRLTTGRLGEAAGRVVGLAQALQAERAAIQIPDAGPQLAELDRSTARALSAFDADEAAELWRETARGNYSVVRIETAANIAVGAAPWGPFAEVGADPSRPGNAAFASHPQFVALESARGVSVPADESNVLVVGRDIHRYAFARDLVDGLRARHSNVLVVDMGWPSDDRRYADVATFGASRLMGRALLCLLDGSSEVHATR
ncbi:beta-N-acetylhexosaminidase [Rathayibacter soli]|uniref:beta-N-acetylhexosaminidase n=1 Tax=Rathayibacter soli TaxID=3144168 RepID=UPI0027E48180|nr:beta-N-acetylhexosaminidase [Glaciibacter superstes]